MYGRIWWCPTSCLMIPKPVSFCYSYFWLLGVELWNDPVQLELIIASFPAKLLSFWHWTLPRFTGWRAVSWWAPPSASLSQNPLYSPCSPPKKDWLFSIWRNDKSSTWISKPRCTGTEGGTDYMQQDADLGSVWTGCDRMEHGCPIIYHVWAASPAAKV